MQRRAFLHTTLGLSLTPFLPVVSPPTPILRFATASDGHFGQPNVDSARDFGKLAEWMQAEKSGKGLDFVVINGDLIHDKPTLLPGVKTALDRLPVPYYVTRGNHDQVTGEAWQQTWGYPLNHSFVRGDYAVILADTSDGKGTYLCPDLAWLKPELAKHAGKKGLFAFMHITPAKWTKYGVACPDAITLLDQTPNLLATFHGHDHDEDGERISPGGKPHFWSGHFSGNWGTVYRGYRVVEVFADGAWRSYQYNPEREPVVNAFEGKKAG